MKKLILLSLITILISLNSVLAYDITSCTNITNSGYYQFTGNVTALDSDCISSNFYSCIYINASSVTLDMKAYSLINSQSCQYGIIILNKDINNIAVTTDNLNILNGEIRDFTASSIRSQANLYNAQITYLNLYGIFGVSDGIELDQNGNSHITIGENFFTNDNYAFNGGCKESCNIYDNEIRYSTKGMILYNYSFDVERNLFGYSIQNDTECFKDDYPVDTGIILYNAHNCTIKNNDIMASYPIKIQAISQYNNIKDNIFRPFYEFEPSVKFEASSTNNIFCNNQKIRVVPTWVYANGITSCYMSTQTTNAKGIVTDLDSNTISDLCSGSCSPNWNCIGTYRVYINSSCGISQNHTCERGCQSGIYGSYCIGNEIIPEITTTIIPLDQQYNISYYTPVISQVDLQDAGMTWITPFFTPFFLIIMLEILISSIVAWISKQPVTFPIVIFILSAVFGVMGLYGIYSIWITALLCIISAVIGGYMFKNVVHG
jgi:hypothetical protein